MKPLIDIYHKLCVYILLLISVIAPDSLKTWYFACRWCHNICWNKLLCLWDCTKRFYRMVVICLVTQIESKLIFYILTFDVQKTWNICRMIWIECFEFHWILKSRNLKRMLFEKKSFDRLEQLLRFLLIHFLVFFWNYYTANIETPKLFMSSASSSSIERKFYRCILRLYSLYKVSACLPVTFSYLSRKHLWWLWQSLSKRLHTYEKKNWFCQKCSFYAPELTQAAA